MMEKGTDGVADARSSMQLVMGPASGEELEGNANTLRIAETFLRLVPIGLCISSLVIMLKNSQENEYGSLAYTDLGAFRTSPVTGEDPFPWSLVSGFWMLYRYLVHANGVCAGYSLLSAAIVAVPRPSTMPRAWTFFLLDQVLTYLILAAGALSTEVLYLAEKGDPSTTWSPACGSFGQFCHKVTASVAITFVAVVCYVMLSLISSYKLFSKYDAPASSSTTGINIAPFHG